LLSQYPYIDWKKVKGLRDIITHQYFDVDAEAIFDVCDTKIKPLAEIIEKIIKDIKCEPNILKRNIMCALIWAQFFSFYPFSMRFYVCEPNRKKG